MLSFFGGIFASLFTLESSGPNSEHVLLQLWFVLLRRERRMLYIRYLFPHSHPTCLSGRRVSVLRSSMVDVRNVLCGL